MIMHAVKKEPIIKTLILVSAFCVLYSHTIVKLVHDWSIDANFSQEKGRT